MSRRAVLAASQPARWRWGRWVFVAIVLISSACSSGGRHAAPVATRRSSLASPTSTEQITPPSTIATSTTSTTTTPAPARTTTTSSRPLQSAAGGPLVPANAVGPYEVVDVVDGDTAKVRIAGLTTTLRLIGIDTPETKDPRRPVECFGREASAEASKLLVGRTVRLTYDSSQDRLDKYGRTLAYIWLSDGQSYGWLMLHDGFAGEYTYDLPYRYQTEFRAEQADARNARRGLWAAKTCNGDLNRAAAPSGPPPTTPPRRLGSPQPIGGGCDPNYSPCVPLAGHDLNCSDVKGPITVIGADPNHFDADGDGVGCEG